MMTEWRRLMGFLKLQVIYRKRATNHTALLRKMIYKDKTSYQSMLPCVTHYTHGVATVSRIDSIIGLFCRVLSLLYVSFAKET